jgi:ribosomal protein S18 acetylase RimI-like enzyme
MIRDANQQDIEAICLLSNEINSEHHEAMPDTFTELGEVDRDADYWLTYMAKDESNILVIEKEGEIQGMAAVSIPNGFKPTFINAKKVCHLSTIVIKATARRQGLGKKLIEAVEHYAHTNDASEVLLDVMAFNQVAVSFYRSIGYGDFSTKFVKSMC